MKQFTLSRLFLLVTFTAVSVSAIVALVRYREIISENSELRSEREDYQSQLLYREEANLQQQLGASFLVDLALDSTGDHRAILQFLDTICDKHLRFREIAIEADERYVICWFSESPFNPDFTDREHYSPKSLCILVDSSTRTIIDSIMGSEGLYSYRYDHEFPENVLLKMEWGSEDGTIVDYYVSRTGFQEAKPDGK